MTSTPFLVKDINPGNSGSGPYNLTTVGDTLYFSAVDGTNGYELWKSDGTSAGTELVKDIRGGFGGSFPQYLTAVGNTLYFTADNGSSGNNGRELWKSNGTEAGTVIVKDINPGVRSDSYPFGLTAFGDTLYFSANDGVNGYELWKSDGTDAGTELVKDINSGDSSRPRGFIAVGDTLYFSADDGVNGEELWKSDGTAPGTELVKDINPGSYGSRIAYTTEIAAIGDTLYFSALSDTGRELWKSDGTEAGTVLVKNINPGSAKGKSSSPKYLTVIGDTLYFSAQEGDNGRELWKSDGTEAGTVLVKDINPGGIPQSPFKYDSDPEDLIAIGDTLYFSAKNNTSGRELWKSDGTEGGTVLVKDINPGGDSVPEYLTAVGDTLYFRADDGTNGQELWKSDGTVAGTVLVEDLNPDGDSVPDYLTAVGDTLYFRADDGTNGYELFALDTSTNDQPETILSKKTTTLPDGVENLVLTGSRNIKGFGNELNNRLNGNQGNNLLDGKGGVDVMKGKEGNDIYIVDDINDRVIEAVDGGIDTIRTTVNETLSANVENLVLLEGDPINGRGNDLNNRIKGNSAKNVINGKEGADKMIGKGGNDIYFVDNIGDRVIEAAGKGIDTVRSSVNETLNANVERLVLIGNDDINGSGNALNNKITGNDADNKLNGKDGKDVITGMLGRDILTGGDNADKFIYLSTDDSGTTAQTRDIITDFSGFDKINLSKIDANTDLSGNQTLTFIGEEEFSTIGQVRFKNGLLSVNNDNDDFAVDMQIKLKGVTELFVESLIL
ncbi:hypothetical protein N9996_01910 [Synechococcus sp. AH-603-M21]|nr:hypothetical protein [Synechococcus sp. AH-603-M21]